MNIDIMRIDITQNLNTVISNILDLFAFVFRQMDAITFNNTSILKIFLGLTILGVAIPIFLTLGKNVVETGERRITGREERREKIETKERKIK